MSTLNETPKPDTVKIGLGRNLGQSKYSRLIAVAIVLFGTLLFLAVDSHKTKVSTECGDYKNDKVVKISGENLNAEVASTDRERSIGLSGRQCIPNDRAMLFVFNKPDKYKMWMKDMKFAIDIIWVSADNKAVAVERDVKPSTYPDRFVNNEALAKYVLEMRANRSSELGIIIGTPVQF